MGRAVAVRLPVSARLPPGRLRRGRPACGRRVPSGSASARRGDCRWRVEGHVRWSGWCDVTPRSRVSMTLYRAGRHPRRCPSVSTGPFPEAGPMAEGCDPRLSEEPYRTLAARMDRGVLAVRPEWMMRRGGDGADSEPDSKAFSAASGPPMLPRPSTEIERRAPRSAPSVGPVSTNHSSVRRHQRDGSRALTDGPARPRPRPPRIIPSGRPPGAVPP